MRNLTRRRLFLDGAALSAMPDSCPTQSSRTTYVHRAQLWLHGRTVDDAVESAQCGPGGAARLD